MSQTVKRGAPKGSRNAAKPEDEKHTKRVPVYFSEATYMVLVARVGTRGISAYLRKLVENDLSEVS